MMEVENRIETFGGQVDELPDDLKDRRINGNHLANGNGVILEESEDEDQGEAAGILEKAPAEAVGGRVIKKVGPACPGQQTVACAGYTANTCRCVLQLEQFKAKRPTKASSFSEPGAPVSFNGVSRASKNLRKSRNAMGRGLPKKGKSPASCPTVSCN